VRGYPPEGGPHLVHGAVIAQPDRPPGRRRTMSPARTTVLTEPPGSGYSLTLPFSSGLNLALLRQRRA